MGQSGSSAPDGRLRCPGPRRSGRWCHGQRGEGAAQGKRASSILAKGGRRVGSRRLAGAFVRAPRGTRLLFPRGSRMEALQMDAPLRLTLVRIGTKLPAAASDKMEDATTTATTPPPPPPPPGAMSAAAMAPSPAAGGGSKASSAEEALLGGAGCGDAGQAPSPGDVNSPFPLGMLPLPMLCPPWE